MKFKSITKASLIVASLISIPFLSTKSFADACSQLAGSTYVSDVATVFNVDTRVNTPRSYLLQINQGGTLVGYNSGEIERLDAQFQSIPSLGSWVCEKGMLYGVMLDFFTY